VAHLGSAHDLLLTLVYGREPERDCQALMPQAIRSGDKAAAEPRSPRLGGQARDRLRDTAGRNGP
jgi:hypothetical protein